MKQVLLYSGAGLLIAGGLVLVLTFVSTSSSPSTNILDGEPIFGTPMSEGDYVKGNVDSAVVLIEYGDFQCPACGSYFPIIKQLEQEFGDQLAIVYRQYPLRRIHRNAETAARASEAAGLQGKFWEMHDLLFGQQKEWEGDQNPQEKFEQYAQDLSLDIEQFKSDINSEVVIQNVQTDLETGVIDRVSGTPTFYLRGQKIANPRSYEEFQQVITAALAVFVEEEPLQSMESTHESEQTDESDETDENGGASETDS